MKQFDFTMNIERRMPKTGEVFCVDRMTSDYAEAHPLDVDGFIESVYQEFLGTEFEESREELHRVWAAVLSVTSVSGDVSLYPNRNGARRAAAMKVWHKAGDYWRRGLRLGDTLPDMVPMTKITRLDDGSWIALFPKDMHFLEDVHAESADSDCYTSAAESVSTQPEPQQETPTMECAERFCREDDPLPAPAPQPAPRPQPKPKAQRQPKRQPEQKQLDLFAEEKPASDSGRQILKAAGYMAALTVVLVVIWQTGLIIPLGLIGLATSGILK